eukprot:6266921-Karenia_brevis.AAC.1
MGNEMMQEAIDFNCRLCHWHKLPYYQSLETTGFCGGKDIVVADGYRWLELGHYNGAQSYSRVCA